MACLLVVTKTRERFVYKSGNFQLINLCITIKIHKFPKTKIVNPSPLNRVQ